MSDLDPEIRDERDAKRYALTVDGQTAVVTYNLVQGGLMVTETLVPVELEGWGIASRLARHVLADVKGRLEDLRRMEAVLEGLISQCGASRGTVRCPLIAALKTDASLSA